MATAYYYRIAGNDHGPVGFRELVRLVHAGALAADDLVRADWQYELQPAATVVGLFHMARRGDVLAAWELERQVTANPSPTETEQPNHPHDESQQGLCETAVDGASATTIDSALTQFDPAQSGRVISRAAGEALSNVEHRSSRRWGPQRFPLFFTRSQARGLFRWGVTITAANLAAWAILDWSALQLQRYPDPQVLAAGLNFFPVWGTCARLEYLVLLADAAVLAGAAGYFGATLVEGLAED